MDGDTLATDMSAGAQHGSVALGIQLSRPFEDINNYYPVASSRTCWHYMLTFCQKFGSFHFVT